MTGAALLGLALPIIEQGVYAAVAAAAWSLGAGAVIGLHLAAWLLSMDSEDETRH